MLRRASPLQPSPIKEQSHFIDVIGTPVTAVPFEIQIQSIMLWARKRLSRIVCVANTHMLVEAYRHHSFLQVLDNADMITPDGMPLVWMLKLLGIRTQDRVAGLDLMLELCQKASEQNVGIYFLGATPSILQRMRFKLLKHYPNLHIAAMEPLPFRPLTKVEDQHLVQRINQSGAGLLMVALGCPKQERWMAAHKHQINAVMIGLGGAFPVYAGIHKRAPLWVRKLGLEWLFRLVQEPKRLWQRYFTTIPVFLFLAFKQLWSNSLFSNSKGSIDRTA